MTLNTEQIKKTVRDLLNLAENDAATEGEIANAIKFARRYMDVHHLSEEECRKAGERVEKFTNNTVYGEVGNLAQWEKNIGLFLLELIGSIGWWRTNRQKVTVNGIAVLDKNDRPVEKVGLVFYGPEEDVNLAVSMFEDLHATIATMARLKWGGTQRGEGRSYAEGFSKGLMLKLQEAEKADKTDVQTTALIVRSKEVALATKKRADSWLVETKKWRRAPKDRYVRRRVNNDAGAYNEGIEDGKRTDTSIARKKKIAGNKGYING